jgi:hypothetical protein
LRTKQEQQLKEVRRGRPNQTQAKARHQAMPGKGNRKETTENIDSQRRRKPRRGRKGKRKKKKEEEEEEKEEEEDLKRKTQHKP